MRAIASPSRATRARRPRAAAAPAPSRARAPRAADRRGAAPARGSPIALSIAANTARAVAHLGPPRIARDERRDQERRDCRRRRRRSSRSHGAAAGITMTMSDWIAAAIAKLGLRRQEPRDGERRAPSASASCHQPGPATSSSSSATRMPTSIPSTVSSTRRGRASRTSPRLETVTVAASSGAGCPSTYSANDERAGRGDDDLQDRDRRLAHAREAAARVEAARQPVGIALVGVGSLTRLPPASDGRHFAAARRESRVSRGTFAVAPASGGTMTSCAAAIAPSSVSTVELGVDRRRPAHDGERDRAVFEVQRRRGDRADDVVADADRGARRGQHAVAAVELQRHEPARRVPEVVHLRDRLLPAVAALAQVHGGAQPVRARAAARARRPRPTSADAMRRRAARRRRRDRRGRARPRPRHAAMRGSSSRVTIASAQSRSAPGCGSTARSRSRPPRCRATGRSRRAARRSARPRRRRASAAARAADDGVLVGRVARVDAQAEAHPAQPRQQRPRRRARSTMSHVVSPSSMTDAACSTCPCGSSTSSSVLSPARAR